MDLSSQWRSQLLALGAVSCAIGVSVFRKRQREAGETKTGDRLRCSGGSFMKPCKCALSQEILYAAMEKRLPPVKTTKGRKKRTKTNPDDPYPQDPLFNVHYANGKWHCSLCTHPIAMHASRGELSGVNLFVEEGSWPSLFSPPKQGAATASELTFVKSSAGDWCFQDDVKSRMIRNKEYPALWQAIVEKRKEGSNVRRKGVLICGQPGIGKTLLLDLLLSWSLNTNPEEPVIVIGTRGVTIFATIDGKQKRYAALRDDTNTKFSAKSVCGHLKALGIKEDASILVLHDIQTESSLPYQCNLVENLLLAFNVTVVVSSSPKDSNYKDYVKQVGPRKFVLPTLSLGETQEFVKSKQPGTTDSTIADYYDKVGGVPRHLVSKEKVASVVQDQRTAMNAINFQPGQDATSATPQAISKVVQVIPSDDRSHILTFDFVSANARRVWVEHQDLTSLLEQLRRFRGAKDEATRDVLGRVFEEFFLKQLKAGEKFCFSPLNPSPGQLKRWVTPASASLSVTYFHGDDPTRIKATPGVNTLYVPLSPTFAVVDAVLVRADNTVTLIQVTVGNRHKPKLAPTKALFDALVANHLVITAFVWVVDSSSKLSKKQKIDGGKLAEYDKVSHYLCRYDEFMCWVQKPVKAPPLCFPMPSQNPTEEEVLSAIKKYVDKGAKQLTNFKGEIGQLAKPLTFRVGAENSRRIKK